MTAIAQALVVDRTGVAQRHDFFMYSSPEDAGALLPTRLNGPLDPSLPSLTTALRDQLGFKLEATKNLTEVLVIDSVDPPTEN